MTPDDLKARTKKFAVDVNRLTADRFSDINRRPLSSGLPAKEINDQQSSKNR
jgi:hypothetical protein